MCLKHSTSPFVYGITTCPTVELGVELVVVVVLALVVVSLCLVAVVFPFLC